MRTTVGILAVAIAVLPIVTIPAHAESPAPLPVAGLEKQPVVSSSTNTILVTFDRAQSDPAQAATDAVAQAADEVVGAGITQVSPITDKIVAVTLDQSVSPQESQDIGKQAEQVDGVKAAEASTTLTSTSTNDTYYSWLWNVKAPAPTFGVDAETAWNTSTGAGTIVGVVDTGITSHPDLNSNVIPGYDFISDASRAGDGDARDADPSDSGDYCTSDPDSQSSSWHGTHVAGIIAAVRDNNAYIAGVAPEAKIEPLRVLGRCDGAEADVIAAITWAAGLPVVGLPNNPHPVSVLNLSLGGSGSCTVAMQSAIDSAVAKGIPVVVAAGNSAAALSTTMPANCKNVISVTASTYQGTLATYSNYGTSSAPATIAAPGGSGDSNYDATAWIWSTYNSGTTTVGDPDFVGMVGTSMAAPHVAATAALLKAMKPSLTPAQIQNYLTSTATAIPACAAAKCGAGVVNAARAVAALAGDLVPSLTTPVIAGTFMVGATLTASASSDGGATISYQWLRSDNAIPGATGATYTLTSDDLGSAISVRATTTLNGAATSKTSVATTCSANSVNGLATPAISGTLMAGAQLTTTGAGAVGAIYGYQWKRDSASVPGGNQAGYTLTRDDQGHQMSVRVTATRFGVSNSKTSATTATVATNTVDAVAKPSISGSAKVGSKLSTVGMGASGASYAYQWMRNGSPIPGATAGYRYLTADDLGTAISVRVTASRYALSKSQLSTSTATVVAGTLSKTKTPYTSGTYKKGRTVQAHAGTWSPQYTKVTYQWLRNGSAIAGAKSSTRKLSSADKGKRISVRVTVSKAGYKTTSATSATHKIS